MRTIVAVLSIILMCLSSTSLLASDPDDRPNIIFVLLDDLGKEWVSTYGADNIETPNVDRLAATGMKFNNAYSMPQCTPTRACFMTGQYPYRNGWVNHWDSPRWGAGHFDWDRNPSLARTMKKAGYVTGVAGKWQLNDFRRQPDAMIHHGFDDYCMWTGAEGGKDKKHTKKSGQRYWDPYIHTKEGSRVYEGEFGPEIYNQFILDFISKNKGRPFFVYYPMALPHGPLVHTPLEPDAKTDLEMHKAMVRYADHLLGKLVAHLEQEQVRDNTIIIWTTDNGTAGKLYNTLQGRTVQGGKTKTTENGVNAPFIVNCPGLVPKGAVSDALVDFSDMHITFAEFAGTTPEAGYDYDGVSQKDVFLGKEVASDRQWILAMGSKPARMTDQGVQNMYYFRDRVVREERFKLFIGSDREPEKLVDLSNDLEERVNLLSDPEYVAAAKRLSTLVGMFPEQDNDPHYTPLPGSTYSSGKIYPANIHKVGYPKAEAAKGEKRSKKHGL